MGWYYLVAIISLMRVQGSTLALVILLAIFVCRTESLHAQTTPGVDAGDFVNYAYMHYYGTGTFTQSGITVYLLRISAGHTLRSINTEPWGLRLRVKTTLGLQNLNTFEDLHLDNIGLFTIVPGIEFQVPTRYLTTVRPFFDVGIGTNSDFSDAVLILATGLRTEYIWAWRSFLLGLEPSLHFSNSWDLDGKRKTNLLKDTFFNAAIKIEGRRPLSFDIGSHRPDIGLFFEMGYLFDSLEFLDNDFDKFVARTQYEVGITIGFTRSRPKVWFYTLPRLSIGYRFGTQLSGLRLRTTGSWVTPLPDP